MPKKELKKPENKHNIIDVLLAINENIGIVTLDICSELKKIRESNEEVIKLLKKKSR